MNEVATTKQSALMDPSNAYNPFAAAADALGGNRGEFLKFNGNNGNYVVGEEEIPHGTRLAVNAMALKHGWICWVDSEPKEKILIPMISGPPPEEVDLTDHGPYKKNADGSEDGWRKTIAIPLVNTLTGENYTLELGTSASLSSVAKTLIQPYGRVFKQHPDEYPVVELNAGSFVAKDRKVGRRYFAELPIIDWVSESKIAQIGADTASQSGGADNPANYAGADGGIAEPAVEPAAATTTPGATGRSTRKF